MAVGDQVKKTGISVDITDARFTQVPVTSGNCLDLSTSGDLLGPVSFAWGSEYAVFFKANIRSTPNSAARLIESSNNIMLSVTGIIVTNAGTQYSMSSFLVFNEWHDYAIVYDGEFLRAYRDGVVVGCIKAPVAPAQTTASYYIFNRSDGARYCDMQVCYLQWYNKSFSPEEVWKHYRNNAEDLTSCRLYYKLTEGTGTEIIDYSGNEEDTTITGGEWTTFSLLSSPSCYAGE